MSIIAVLPVIGPLWQPTCRSGVTWGRSDSHRCQCDHTSGQSCRLCDGTASDDAEQRRAERDADRAREQRMRSSSERAAWLASLPPLTRALLQPDTSTGRTAR